MWKGVRSGIADMGWCVQGYWPEQTPLSDVMSLPFLPLTTAEKSSEVLWKLYEKFPAMQKEYGEIQPLVLHTSSSNLLVSKKPVKTLEDLKGMKFRVLGGPPTEMAKALGAVPTLIPMPDVYQSARQGRGRRRRRAVGGDPRLPALRGGEELHRGAVLWGLFLDLREQGEMGERCPRTCATRS